MMRRFCIAIIGGALLSGAAAHAAMGRIPLDVLAANAEVIAHGRVKSVTTPEAVVETRSPQTKEIDVALWNIAEFTVDALIKGPVALRSLLIEFRGANEDGPDYRPGEEAVVFLQRIDGKEAYRTVGMLQGKYLVQGEIVVRENVSTEDFSWVIRALVE